MGTKAEAVDAYFGEDTYDWAMELIRRTHVARKDYDTFVKRYFGVYDDGLWIRLDLMERIEADIEAAFVMTHAGQFIDRKQFQGVIQLYETASDCVELELEQLHGMFALGLAAALSPFVKMFPFRELAQELKAYESALANLKDALAKAKREHTEAWIDKSIDIVQGVVTFAFPQITLAKEVALGVSGLFADSRLGPQDPDASKIARTTATTLKNPILKLTKMSSALDGVAGVASKMNALYDIANFDEIDAAKGAIKKVEQAIANEKATHKRIVQKIWAAWRTRTLTFLASLERGSKQLEESAKHLEEVRSALREQDQLSGYKPPIAWRRVAAAKAA